MSETELQPLLQPLLTDTGAEQLRIELLHLERTTRPAISAAIGTARAHGDLSENAEYHAAKEKQGFTEARIKTLRGALGSARVVALASLTAKGKVDFGMIVDLCNLNDDSKVSYQIVGEQEADAAKGRISEISPVARALLGKNEDDIITLHLPAGQVDYEILRIRAPDLA